MRCPYLYAGVALAALAGLAPNAPAQAHAPASRAARASAACPLPAGWSVARLGGPDDPWHGLMIVNDIAVLPSEGQRWNGQPLDREMLGSFLQIAEQLMPPPALVLWRDGGAGCDDLAATAAFIASRFPCSPERCRIADAGPPRQAPPPPPPAPPSPAQP